MRRLLQLLRPLPASFWPVVVTIVASLTCTLLFCRPLYYQENDDAYMRLLVSGRLGGGVPAAPSPYILHSHALLGHALATLYTAWPAAPWYDIALLAAALTALTAVTRAATRHARNGLALAGLMAVCAGCGILTLTNLQFTIVATLLAFGGAWLWLSELAIPKSAGSARATMFVVGGGCIAWAALIRSEAAWLGSVCAAPLAWAYVRRAPDGLRAARRAAVGFGFTMIVVLIGLSLSQTALYARSPEWFDCLQFNAAKRPIVDDGLPATREDLPTAYSAAGLSANDVALLQQWFFLDPSVFTAESLQRLTTAVAALPQRSTAAGSLLWTAPDMLVVPCLAIGVWSLCVRPRRWTADVLIVAGWGFIVTAACVLLHRAPPLRVSMPIWMCALTATVALFHHPPAVPTRTGPDGAADRCSGWRNTRRAADAAGLLVGVLALAIVGKVLYVAHVNQSAIMASAAQARGEQAQLLSAINPRSLLVNWKDALQLRLIVRPFQEPAGVFERPLFHVCWATRTPPNRHVLQRFCGAETPHRCLTRSDVVYVAGWGQMQILQNFLREHYQFETSIQTVYQGQTVEAFRLSLME